MNLLVSETGPLRRLAPTTNGGDMEPGLRSLRGSLGERERDRFAAYPIPADPLLRIAQCCELQFKFVCHSIQMSCHLSVQFDRYLIELGPGFF